VQEILKASSKTLNGPAVTFVADGPVYLDAGLWLGSAGGCTTGPPNWITFDGGPDRNFIIGDMQHESWAYACPIADHVTFRGVRFGNGMPTEGGGVASFRSPTNLLIENSIFDDVRIREPAKDHRAIEAHKPVDFGPGHPVILYAGTFEVYQGIEILIEAFAHVVRQRPEARLLLVGGTTDQVRRLRVRADSLGLGDTCILTGPIPKSAAIRYTQSAKVLISPRLHGTNTPLKIYEQLASGRPLVATRIWSHTQVLDDSVCYLVEPNPLSLAEGLVTALTDESGSAGRARNARALYEREYARPAYERKIQRLLEIVA